MILDFNRQEFETGELIINENEIFLEIFELITGSAVAIHNDEAMGTITKGGIFGGIRFVTENSRTATVEASENMSAQNGYQG